MIREVKTKTYYEELHEKLGTFYGVGDLISFMEEMKKADFSKIITKDSDAELVAELHRLKDLIAAKAIKSNVDAYGNLKKEIETYFSKQDLSKKLLEIQPMFYDEYRMWWVWNSQEFKWEIKDDVDVLNYVNVLSSANTVNSKDKAEILESLKQTSRKCKPKPIEPTWIQFKDTIVDIITGVEMKASPKYFVTNPIKYELHGERFVNTPKMDEIFEEWVGKENVKLLYEIIAYCLLPDYPIHRLFCFIGGGMNGKSCFMNLLKKFVGVENVTSVELDTLITSRFEVSRLHKKLVCIMGETNFTEMSKTSVIKKLTGGDLIGFEYKNKNPFEDANYAKILIATNNLPTTSDKTIGFYRRWTIIDFPNQFSEQQNILDEIPEEEYEILAVKCLGILKDLLERRSFTNEGSLEEREKKYEEKSNPFDKFVKEFTNLKDPNSNIPKWEFEKTLNEWLVENRHRKMASKTISKSMRDKGVEDGRVSVEWFENDDITKKQVRAWLGIKWKVEEK